MRPPIRVARSIHIALVARDAKTRPMIRTTLAKSTHPAPASVRTSDMTLLPFPTIEHGVQQVRISPPGGQWRRTSSAMALRYFAPVSGCEHCWLRCAASVVVGQSCVITPSRVSIIRCGGEDVRHARLRGQGQTPGGLSAMGLCGIAAPCMPRRDMTRHASAGHDSIVHAPVRSDKPLRLHFGRFPSCRRSGVRSARTPAEMS